jgi:hypothetical protein
MQTSTLRPGFLVSLKTSLRGNVSYVSDVIESEHVTSEGSKRAKWETQRTIADPAEFEAAKQARQKARSAVSRICALSAFGLMCPEAAAADLEAAIAEARQIADAFNASARLTQVKVYVLTGRIAPDDIEAVRAINSEVRELLAEMRDGINNLDVEAVRTAASKARRIASMLTPDAQARVQTAIDAARRTARRMSQAGEQAAQEIDRATLAAITDARTAFLDLDDESTEVLAPKADARAIDLTPEIDLTPLSVE